MEPADDAVDHVRGWPAGRLILEYGEALADVLQALQDHLHKEVSAARAGGGRS
jgi:hypothetical protein